MKKYRIKIVTRPGQDQVLYPQVSREQPVQAMPSAVHDHADSGWNHIGKAGGEEAFSVNPCISRGEAMARISLHKKIEERITSSQPTIDYEYID